MTTTKAEAGTKHIRLVTEVPGPRSQAILDRREAATPQGNAKLTPISIESAHGALVTDVDGNQYIDLAGGIGVLAVGHTPEGVVRAMQEQAAKLVHMCAIVATYEPFVEVAEKLNSLAPGDFAKKTVLMNTGAEAVETAVHISRSHSKRQGIVVFEGGYHGRTNLTMAMTSKFNLFKKGFGPFAPEVYRFPFPNLYRRPQAMSEEAFVEWNISLLDHAFTAQVDPSHVAAIVVEPIQGEGGFVPAPFPWLQRLAELAAEHGILLVSDEIQAGMGRTGRLWAIEHSGVVPDMITTAKSLAAGMPLSAVVGPAEVMDAPHPGGLGGTYSGNPLACVAALEAIDEIATPAFLRQSTLLGEKMRARLLEMQARYPKIVGDVRGLGSMLVMEIVKDSVSKEPWMEATAAITAATVKRGVITIRAGLYSNCVRFLPPLNISDEQLEEALDVVELSLDEVASQLGAR
ncbi:MAG TPA: aspartate aminotransferase family protein [Acidimicrobiia bacterium]|nr:aspartate aminotransferase family protein [Acidimicrobiia bacterium]